MSAIRLLPAPTSSALLRIHEMPNSRLAYDLAMVALELGAEAKTSSNLGLIKHCLIDAAAAAVAGFDSPVADIAGKFAIRTFGTGTISPWFSSTGGMMPISAAFVNSSVMSALDLDDGNRAARGHLGAAVVPVASVLGSMKDASSQTFAHAVLAGCEIGARLGSVETPPFFASGRWAGVGAAVAAGISLGLDYNQLAHAIALSVHAAPLLGPAGARKDMTGHIKEGVPFGVLSGMACALLAEQGYRGDPDAIESAGIYDVGRLSTQTGEATTFKRTYFKRFSCCRLAHSPIDAALAITWRERLVASDIARITVRTFRTAMELPNEARPASFESAQYSLPFAVAVALVLGTDALLPLAKDTLSNSEVLALAERVDLLHDATMDAAYPRTTPTEVLIETHRGEIFVEERDTADGDPGRAFADEQLLHKLRTVAKDRIPVEQLEEIVSAVGSRIPSACEFEAVLRRASE